MILLLGMMRKKDVGFDELFISCCQRVLGMKFLNFGED